MAVNKELREDMLSYISELKEETAYMIFYSLSAYFNSLVTFGISSEVTKDCLSVLKEYTNISLYELKILRYLKKNYKNIEDGAIYSIIDTISDRKEDATIYYYQVLDDIEVAIDMKMERKAKRARKPFVSIYEDKDLIHDILSSSLTVDDIIKYFNFSDLVIPELKKIIEEEIYLEDEDEFGLEYKLNHKNVCTDLKIKLPTIVDYKTALMNANILNEGYYYMLSKLYKTPVSVEEFKRIGNLKANAFNEEYILKKAI